MLQCMYGLSSMRKMSGTTHSCCERVWHHASVLGSACCEGGAACLGDNVPGSLRISGCTRVGRIPKGSLRMVQLFIVHVTLNSMLSLQRALTQQSISHRELLTSYFPLHYPLVSLCIPFVSFPTCSCVRSIFQKNIALAIASFQVSSAHV